MNFRRIGLIGLALIASIGLALAQQGAFPNYPIVGGAAYCSSTTNAVCTNTVPAGPTALTGNENIPANTNLSNGRIPQNVLIKPASIGALPLTFATGSATPTGISASNIQGGVVYTHTTTITSAGITLPSSAIDGQQFVISSNRTITTLTVNAASGDSMVANSAPTVLTASTVGPQGYKFVCAKSGTACTWWRLQ